VPGKGTVRFTVSYSIGTNDIRTFYDQTTRQEITTMRFNNNPLAT